MSQPIRPVTPTQVRHPWRATLRTTVATTIAILPVLPAIVEALGLSGYAWAAGALGIAAGITRVLAIPAVNVVVSKYIPVLAATPRRP